MLALKVYSNSPKRRARAVWKVVPRRLAAPFKVSEHSSVLGSCACAELLGADGGDRRCFGTCQVEQELCRFAFVSEPLLRSR